jgi:glyoxylate reductase
MRVFVTRALPGDVLERADIPADVEVWPEDVPIPYDELLARVPDLDGLLCMLTDRIDEPLLRSAKQLKVISQMAVGVDNIDLTVAKELGIPVGHTPGVLTETTADLAFALILAVMRRITESERDLRAGRWTSWSPTAWEGTDVHGATLGIVGFGAIGQALGRRAQGFGMEVIYTSRTRKRYRWSRKVSLEELLRTSDVVSINTALTPQTRGMIGADELALMKPDAFLVNTARGGIVDEDALIEALRARRIAGAGLDVYATEPLPSDSPLLDLPNVVLLPHIGSATVATRERMAQLAIDNLVAGLRDVPLPACAN